MGNRGRAPLVEEEDIARAPEGVQDALLLLAEISDTAHATSLALSLGARPGVAWAEVWVEAPCPIPLRPEPPGSMPTVTLSCVGSSSIPPNDAAAALHGIVCAVQDKGVVAMLGSMRSSQVERLKRGANERIRVFEEALASKHSHLVGGTSQFAFIEVGSRGDHRFDLLFDPLDSCIEGTDENWIPIVARLLGSSFNRAVSVVYSDPGAPDQPWHADGQHLGPDAGWAPDGVPSPPYALCVFVPLVDLDATVGFTQFWPGSHAQSQLVGFGEACAVLGQNADGIVRRGDAVLYDYRTLHRGMKNESCLRRPLVQYLYSVPSYAEVRNYGKDSLFS